MRLLRARGSDISEETSDFGPGDVELSDVEPSDVEPSDVEPSDVEPSDVEPSAVDAMGIDDEAAQAPDNQPDGAALDQSVWLARDDEPAAKGKRQPLYPRLLRLRHLNLNAWQRVLLGDGPIVAGVLLVLADLASAWTILALPVAVALMVKVNDVLAGVLATPRPPGSGRKAWGTPVDAHADDSEPATADPDVDDRDCVDGAAESGEPHADQPVAVESALDEPAHDAGRPVRAIDDYPTAGMQEAYRAAALAAAQGGGDDEPADEPKPSTTPTQRRGPARVSRRRTGAAPR